MSEPTTGTDTGPAEYLVPEPGTAVPAEVTVVVPEPAEEQPPEPSGDPEETTEPSGTSAVTSTSTSTVGPAVAA
ncbi:hypothetical protein ACFVGN_17470 [Streptomyces sp. NPDC057757]|uniref:hypothetical protein n=1 Tax=Streptomyces sp. NPDC057757 TaxID=3346241 RepID=UPI0036800708